MTTARELLQEALTYSNAWLTALEADGEDEAAASQAEFNERITSFLAQPEPEPSAEVERIMELADQYYRSAYHDESSIERESLRAEVERLMQERDRSRELLQEAMTWIHDDPHDTDASDLHRRYRDFLLK